MIIKSIKTFVAINGNPDVIERKLDDKISGWLEDNPKAEIVNVETTSNKHNVVVVVTYLL